MELAVLAPFSGGFKRDTLFENYTSLVWTERYSTFGDFEMVSYDISETLSRLPLGGPLDPPCLVAIRDSDVPMIVESHKIETPKNEAKRVVTTGRSYESVLDRRAAIRAITSGVKRVEWQINATSAATAAYAVAKAIIVDGVATPLDIIPEILLLNGTSDLTINAEANLKVLAKGLKLNKNVTVKKISGANHLFQPDPTKWPIVNGQQQPNFSPEAQEIIREWIVAQTKK